MHQWKLRVYGLEELVSTGRTVFGYFLAFFERSYLPFAFVVGPAPRLE